MQLSTEELEQLIPKVQMGDISAFEAVYKSLSRAISSYLARRAPANDVEDIVAVVWIKISKGVKQYKKRQSASFKAWVWRIVSNALVDYYRTKSPEITLDTLDLIPLQEEKVTMPPTPDELYQKKLQHERIHRTLTLLKPEAREVIEMCYIQDLTHKEAAEVLGKTEGNIRIIKLRALRQLRRLWESSPEEATYSESDEIG